MLYLVSNRLDRQSSLRVKHLDNDHFCHLKICTDIEITSTCKWSCGKLQRRLYLLIYFSVLFTYCFKKKWNSKDLIKTVKRYVKMNYHLKSYKWTWITKTFMVKDWEISNTCWEMVRMHVIPSLSTDIWLLKKMFNKGLGKVMFNQYIYLKVH